MRGQELAIQTSDSAVRTPCRESMPVESGLGERKGGSSGKLSGQGFEETAQMLSANWVEANGWSSPFLKTSRCFKAGASDTQTRPWDICRASPRPAEDEKGPSRSCRKISSAPEKKAGRLARLHVHGPDESEHLACLLGLFQKGIHPRIDGFRTERAGMPVSRSAGSSIVMLFVLHRLGQRLIIIGCQFLPHETPCQVVIDAGRRFSETQGPKAVGRGASTKASPSFFPSGASQLTHKALPRKAVSLCLLFLPSLALKLERLSGRRTYTPEEKASEASPGPETSPALLCAAKSRATTRGEASAGTSSSSIFKPISRARMVT